MAESFLEASAMRTKLKTLRSGKTIQQNFDLDGQLATESHSYGDLGDRDIQIIMHYTDGIKTQERYFVKNRMVSRKRYAKAREQYADMPEPDVAMEAVSAEELKSWNARKRHSEEEWKQRQDRIKKETLPSGKIIRQEFDTKGRLSKETHMYGFLETGIELTYENGVKTREMYFVNRKMASRKRYETARKTYVDLPAADAQLEDWCGDLLKMARAEQRRHAKAAQTHIPDKAAARQVDAFCKSLLKKGKRADAETWIEKRGHTIGEYTEAQGRSLIRKLKKSGAKAIYACDIDHEVEDEETTNHLIVELPEDPETRPSVFNQVARIAKQHGFEGDPEDGQRYAYIFLD